MTEDASLAAFFEAWELFELSALAGTIAGALLGFLGVYVVLRRLVFLTAAVSQAAGLGVALAFYATIHLGVPAILASPTGGAALLTLLAVLPIATDRGPPSARRDSILGLGYLVGAAGTLAVSTRIVQEIQDIHEILFGSAVAVLPQSFAAVLVVAGLLFVVHVWGWRGFALASFDPAGARVRGLPVRALDLVLLASLALAISVSTRILGALPTFAFSVLPAMAAVRIAPHLPAALALATLFGALAGFLGYVVAFMAKLPVGAAQTLVGAAIAALAELSRVALRARKR